MKNKYFKDEDITANDVLLVCSMIGRIARKIHRRNRDHPICDIIDDYNASAYYEPSYWLAAGYRNGSL